jgi:dephospho-CoA kinase
LLGELGAETVSSDGIVHDLLSSDRRAIDLVVERFGEEVRGDQGINRPALSRRVFADSQALTDLEGILHPLVREATDERMAATEAEVFVAEVPLLFEVGRGVDFDHTVAVVTPLERRRTWSEERGVDEVRRRSTEARQFSAEEKARRAEFVVENDGDLDKLRQQALAIWENILR